MTLFECRNVCKRIQDFSISHISFQFPAGEIIGVIGANGAGKSTLFNTIAGRYRLNREQRNDVEHDEGDIVLCGYDMERDQREFRRSMILIDVQNPFSVWSCAAEIGDLYGSYYPSFNASTYRAFLKRFRIDEKKKTVELSTGEVIRLQLAFAFAASVPLLLLDELAANLDWEFREEFYDLLREYVSDGEHAVLMASHILGELEGIADRILWMERKEKIGRMRYFGMTDDLRENYRMVKDIPEGMDHLVIGGRKTEHAEEYLLDAASMNREDILRMKNDPRYALRYPSLVEILYYCTKEEVAYD